MGFMPRLQKQDTVKIERRHIFEKLSVVLPKVQTRKNHFGRKIESSCCRRNSSYPPISEFIKFNESCAYKKQEDFYV